MSHALQHRSSSRRTEHRESAASRHLEVSPAVANTLPGKLSLEVLRRWLRPLPRVNVQNGQPSLYVWEWKHELPAEGTSVSGRAIDP